MNELPVFISYREEDGAQLARWLHEVLYGQSRTLRGPYLYLPAIVSTFLAPAGPAVGDWRNLHDKELNRALALVVVCTPGAMTDFGEKGEVDWFYREIRWWLEHRSAIAPILVSSSRQSTRWIPKIISTTWPHAQIVKVDPLALSSPPPYSVTVQNSIESILGGIARAAYGGDDSFAPGFWREVGMSNQTGVYSWEKDLYGRYINANENYARAAGFDSPHAMIGKTDYDMPWRALADFFRAGDHGVVSGSEIRLAVQEKEVMVDRVADILVCEGQLLDRFDRCVGVTGSFMDITGRQVIKRPVASLDNATGLNLGEEFGNESLSYLEVEVFRRMVRGLSVERIANDLSLGRDVVASRIHSIKRKFGCSTLGDVIVSAIRSGLPLSLFGLILEG